QGRTYIVLDVAFTPDGKTLATASWDKDRNNSPDHTDCMVKLWGVASGRERATLTGHTTFVTSIAFSPDGKKLASAAAGGTIMLWDMPGLIRTGKLSPEDLDGLWSTLAGEDAKKAYRAIGKFVGTPEQTISLLKERMRPALKADIKEIAHWI